MKEHILDVINSDGKAISFDDTRKAEEYFSSLDKGTQALAQFLYLLLF